jgi:hypothetical protein
MRSGMRTDRIEFISSYCDRWCERCAFTERCSSFACTMAIGMCGDVAAGIELAVGAPRAVGGEPPESAASRLLAELLNVEPSAKELEALGRHERARDARLDRAPLTRKANACMRRSTAWLKTHHDRAAECADPLVREALEVVMHDAFFIGAKLHRALDGRDRHQHGEEEDDHHPVQNDWNGSAKVALISLERSEAAWRTIGEITADGAACAIADAVRDLRRLAHDEFPDAMSFIRPGFDEPWQWETPC